LGERMHRHLAGIVVAISWLTILFGALTLLGYITAVSDMVVKPDAALVAVTATGILIGTGLVWAMLMAVVIALDYLADIRDEIRRGNEDRWQAAA